jgi:hypothetical protein
MSLRPSRFFIQVIGYMPLSPSKNILYPSFTDTFPREQLRRWICFSKIGHLLEKQARYRRFTEKYTENLIIFWYHTEISIRSVSAYAGRQ